MSGGFRTRTQRLRGRDFYHGMIQRADVDELLRNNGDYLLRKTENSNQLRLALSVYWKDQVRHFIIQENDDEVYFEDGGPRDQDVESLIKHIARKRKPVTKQSGVMLKRAIPREDWVLTHESITLNGRLGAGQFGEVSKGLLKTASGQELDVAVKTLRDASVENQKSFLSEARTMRQLRHDNVVRIYGVAVYEKPFMICMEHCGGGSLLHHLRTRHPDSDIKLRWVTEAAKGLEYIANQGLVHRDIAARNCLLTEKELRLKIADFGLTIQQATAAQVVQGKMPIKWLAKETMELGIYNKQTDIWSYAILCWEVYSDGAEPYPGMTNLQARTQILLHGHRMDIPKCAPTKVAALIQQCWNADARERPAFTTIVERLTRK